jgi:hypothetical protein
MNESIFDIPCLECGSLPEQHDFKVSCSNEKCRMHIRQVDPELWPCTREDFDAAWEAAGQPTEE